jgi:glucose/arabinose dehydrogenase
MKIVLAIALLAPGVATAQVVHQGQAAYGDWHTDAPGVVRHLTEADLPPFDATPSASHGPRVIPRPAGAAPAVPKGFTVQLWATGLDMPRSLRTAPNGDVFLAESGSGRILAWRPQVGASHPGSAVAFASHLNQPFGIAFWPPVRPRFVYVAETSRIVRYPYDGRTEAAGPAEVIVPHLPEGGHWTRDLAAAPDGTALFVSVGSASNIARGMRGTGGSGSAAAAGAATGDEAGRAAVFRFSPEGGPLQIVASGIRNCVGVAIEPKTGSLWCATNERDGLGDDLPPDYVTRVTPGAFYGWPWYYIGDHEDPRHKGERPDLRGQISVPDVLIQPHSAPLGVTFYNGNSFPADYEGDGFVTLHGSWNRARRTGYKVVRIKLRDGVPTGDYQDFLTGFVANDDAVWGRPVGVTVMQDGSLLVSEDGNGTIWRVSYGPR